MARAGVIGYLGLGSNVGDRLAHLREAAAALPARGVEVLAASSVYETEAVGEVLDQPEFLNACLRVRTDLPPEELLDACKAVESDAGRARAHLRHGPRVIDVDVLLLGDLVHSSERLSLPHAEVTSRRFVLVPLLELDPELRTPEGARLADALDALDEGQAVARVGPPLVPADPPAGAAPGRRPSPVFLLAAGWALLLCAWAFGNPPFAAPDEGAHFVRTAGVAEGTLVGRELAEPLTPLVLDPTPRRTAWVAQTTRAVEIPGRLSGRGADCFALDPTRSAACAESAPPVAPEQGTVRAISTVGTYEPLPYLLPAVATIPASNGDDADRLARLALAVTALALLALAAALVWDAGAGGLSLLGLAVAVTPMVIFSGASLNGSGLEIAAGVAFAAALLRVWRGSGASALGWAGTGATGAVLALSRSTGPIWVALLAGGWLALLGPRAAVAAARSRPAAAVAGGAVLAALVANRVWEAAYGARPPLSLRAARTGLTTGLEQIGFAADEVVGQFGYLEWRLPVALLALGGAAVAGLLAAAFAVAGRRERIALLGALAGAVLVPLGLWVLFLRHTGFGLQGRHVLPLLVAVPLLGGEILVRARARITARVRAALCGAAAVAVAVVHFGAWWYNARRAATGTDGPLFFVPDAEWSPPLGWTPWLLMAAAGAALVVAAIVGPGARPADERRQPA